MDKEKYKELKAAIKAADLTLAQANELRRLIKDIIGRLKKSDS